jgi:hypothetical protein
LQASQCAGTARLHPGAMHAEIGAASRADRSDLRRAWFVGFGWHWRGWRRGRRRRLRRWCRGRARRLSLIGCWRGWRRRRRRRFSATSGRLRADRVKRRLARRRYAAGVALETLERVLAARLNAGAMRHEIGTAGLADGRNLFGRGLLGKGRRKPSAEQHGSQNQTTSHAGMPDLHSQPPRWFAPRSTTRRRPSSMRCIALSHVLCGPALVC